VEDAIGGDVAARARINAQLELTRARDQLIGLEHGRGRLLHRLLERLLERPLARAHPIAGHDRRLSERLERRLLREHARRHQQDEHPAHGTHTNGVRARAAKCYFQPSTTAGSSTSRRAVAGFFASAANSISPRRISVSYSPRSASSR